MNAGTTGRQAHSAEAAPAAAAHRGQEERTTEGRGSAAAAEKAKVKPGRAFAAGAARGTARRRVWTRAEVKRGAEGRSEGLRRRQ
eukprot:606643-Prymnesium_polylepis.1